MAAAGSAKHDASYWFVGAAWGGTDDQSERFIAEGIWENGYEDRYLDDVKQMREGDSIAIKSTFTRKHDLPFENFGHTVSVMRIKAVGTIVENPGDGRSVRVAWKAGSGARDWYFYTGRATVWRVRPGSDEADALLDFAFAGAPQDYHWWRTRPYWRDRLRQPDDASAWTGFYEALADRLREWRTRRAMLVKLVHEAVGAAGDLNPLVDEFAEGDRRPLDDIDPFTFFGIFNRRITDERRLVVALRFAERLEVSAQTPNSFAGIPILNNQKSWFFHYARERDPQAIERLWDVFEAALVLAASDDRDSREQFAAAFDAARTDKGVRFNLGIGLFWISPWRFPSLDKHTRRAIARELSEPEMTAPPTGADYLFLTDLLLARFGAGSAFQSMPQLVRDAWNREEDEEDDEEDEEDSGVPVEEERPDTQFVSDDAEMDRDEIGRGALAIAMAKRLQKIWHGMNAGGTGRPGEAGAQARDDLRAAFVVHIDAPWGGGKTSFANFLVRTLNPYGDRRRRPAQFLVERYGDAFNYGSLFLEEGWPGALRRPWVSVWFNAWQAEHCAPPWWVFYQAIRKQTFDAILWEGDEALEPGGAPPRSAPSLGRRLWRWAGLWRREFLWRLSNPKVKTLLGTAAVSITLLWVLTRFDVIGVGAQGGLGFVLGNGIGLGLAALTGLSAIWGVGTLLTESIAPGTNTLAERMSLGGGDPYERFRRHFHKMMRAVRRPVIVVIDDLDRCRPEFVVDLVRGIQTLLRSPRVVFVILGDRDWIERAFEAHHAAMNDSDAVAEQSFGARFVEKAIQMSFILPEMAGESQQSYVRGILVRSNSAAPSVRSNIAPQVATRMREMIRAESAKAGNIAEFEQVRQDAIAAYGKEKAGEAGTPSPAIIKLINEEMAINAASSDSVRENIKHRLEPLADCLPANPRQIKRIINAVTMYYAVALQQFQMTADDPKCLQLAIWVVIMTEWPESWRLLASCPDLIDVLKKDDLEAGLAELTVSLPASLPASLAATLAALTRMRSDARLLQLIRGDRNERPALQRKAVMQFRTLIPLYRAPRLGDLTRSAGEH